MLSPSLVLSLPLIAQQQLCDTILKVIALKTLIGIMHKSEYVIQRGLLRCGFCE